MPAVTLGGNRMLQLGCRHLPAFLEDDDGDDFEDEEDMDEARCWRRLVRISVISAP